MRRLLFGTTLLTFMSGCQLLTDLFNQAFEKPTLTFQRLEVKDASLGGATLNLHYALNNPNAIGIDLASITYALAVEGHPVVSGSPPNGLSVPAGGSTELVFPAQVRFSDLVPAVEAFLTKDTFHYKADGSIGVNTPVGVVSLPLSKEGDVETPKLPSIQIGSPRILSMSWSEASVELPLTLTSRNSYPLPFGSVSGALSIGGSHVAQVQGPALGTLAPRATQTFTVPISIHLGEAASAASALARGEGTLAFRGSLGSGPIAIPLNFSQNVRFER